MVLKKQTVWLLTMLSLIVVLSVYYITTPGSSEQMAGNDQEQKETSANKDSEGVTSSIESDSSLAEFRNQKLESRDELASQYNNTVIASEDAITASKAKTKLETLETLEKQEKLLKNWIMNKGYNDAVVFTKGEDVNVYVETDSMSAEQANAIMRAAAEYLGVEKNVQVIRR